LAKALWLSNPTCASGENRIEPERMRCKLAIHAAFLGKTRELTIYNDLQSVIAAYLWWPQNVTPTDIDIDVDVDNERRPTTRTKSD
jgi:hypothetical protein